MHTVKQGTRYSLQRKFQDSEDQVYNPRILTAAKMGLAAAMTRHSDKLKHETLGYKRGRNSHFEGGKREKTARTQF